MRIKIVLAGLLLASCGPGFDPVVEPTDVAGEAWPLTVPSVTVDCTNGLDVFIVADGVGYQIRGGERTGPEAFDGPVGDLRQIRKLDEDLQTVSPGVMVDMSETRRVALQRCVDAGLARFEL